MPTKDMCQVNRATLTDGPVCGAKGFRIPPMKFTNKKVFGARLRSRFPDYEEGWLYNYLESAFGCEPYTISSRAKLDTLITKTKRIAATLGGGYPLIAFPNGMAGWRGVPTNRRLSPVQISSPDDLSELLRSHIYFRDPKRFEDNYHITDASFSWIAIFCHHGDWHLYAPSASISIAKGEE